MEKKDTAMQFTPGTKIEAQDLTGGWHNASVIEVDQGEQEVLIKFAKNMRAKGANRFKLNEEWISMDSSRLRIPVQVTYEKGDRCLARWTDSRKFPATVLKPLENNKYEVLFDDGFVKHVKGNHMTKMKQPTNEIATQSSDSPLPPIQPIIRNLYNPIPKFDLSKFNLPEIPEGEWCCPWINDTPIGDEGFLLNADGTKRPTVLVQDKRLPAGWTKHLYRRSSTSIKWDVMLVVDSNNKRFRSRNDVKVYLDEIGQAYNPDTYDFSIHKRRAKDIGVYVYTDDYVPPVQSSDFNWKSNLNSSLQRQPFAGFSPNESTILSKIAQEIKTEPNTSTFGVLGEDFIYLGALKVKRINNSLHCPKEDCDKHFRKENHLYIHVKHYHSELADQLNATTNKIESPISQAIETTNEPKTVGQSLTLVEQTSDGLKRKLDTNLANLEVKEKRKPSEKDKVNAPDINSVDSALKECAQNDFKPEATASAPKKSTKKRTDTKLSASKSGIPKFKINPFKIKALKGKKSKKMKREFKRKIKKILINHDNNDGRSTQLNFSNSECSTMDLNFQQQSGSQYVDENGEIIKIVRMRQEEIVNCKCDQGQNGLMIQCELCLFWQHAVCYNMTKESEVPEKYVCWICRHPENIRESMRYIHDQDWLYDGKLFQANYHQPSDQAAMRSDILQQSHQLTGNLLEVNRSLHSLNVKLNIASNKDHPKLYLWSKKWEQSPPRNTETKVEQEQHTSVSEVKSETITNPALNNLLECVKPENESETTQKNEMTLIENKTNTDIKIDKTTTQQQIKQAVTPKKLRLTPNIPQPEAAIDSVECQHHLLEHIQNEQSIIHARMQTIDAQIVALESMEYPHRNTKSDFAKTNHTIRMLLNDLDKMKKLAAFNRINSRNKETLQYVNMNRMI
ncbi:PHD finger protein 20-like [Contarinia nasturtii]|uniref:PHD finger protein 20-like n=1 Tax=Contarinia nasturtii TaxID=265458 RepID=UPI0012D4C182|nr:PHD finger protein 20-like [Contarinia nasturtii]